MKNIFAYVGSSRGLDSNTYFGVNLLKQKVLKKYSNINFEIFTSSDVKINFCTGCNHCIYDWSCPFDKIDDMGMLKQKMLEADIIIFASPNYIFNVSAQLKVFLDRLHFWYHSYQLVGKIGTVLMASGSPQTSIFENNGTIKYLSFIQMTLGLNYVDGVLINATTKRNILDKDKANNDVENLANVLSQYINDEKRAESNKMMNFLFRNNKRKVMEVDHFSGIKKYWEEKGIMEFNNFEELLKKKIMNNVPLSPTSALVLRWTKGLCYTTFHSKKYLELLDYSASDDLFNKLNKVWKHYGEVVINRKYSIWELIKSGLKENEISQVVILAAGLAPLSLELKINYPELKIFDIDYDLMEIKDQLYNEILPDNNVNFIKCDISKTELLFSKLVDFGWDSEKQSIIIYEGISYYLPKETSKEIFNKLTSNCNDSLIVADIMPPSEQISEKTRQYPEKLFRIVCDNCNVNNETRFTHSDIFNFGYDIIKLLNLHTAELKRKGKNEFFHETKDSFRDIVMLKKITSPRESGLK